MSLLRYAKTANLFRKIYTPSGSLPFVRPAPTTAFTGTPLQSGSLQTASPATWAYAQSYAYAFQSVPLSARRASPDAYIPNCSRHSSVVRTQVGSHRKRNNDGIVLGVLGVSGALVEMPISAVSARKAPRCESVNKLRTEKQKSPGLFAWGFAFVS